MREVGYINLFPTYFYVVGAYVVVSYYCTVIIL